jgi:hypothetical protein
MLFSLAAAGMVIEVNLLRRFSRGCGASRALALIVGSPIYGCLALSCLAPFSASRSCFGPGE